MTIVLAITSDHHAGSTVALCPPHIDLDDGGRYEASRAQQWLWQSWWEFWDAVSRERDKHKAKLYTIFNGDLVDGNHHGTTQILSGNPTAQSRAVDACLKPVLGLKPDAMFFVRGTEAHVGKSAAYEERIALGLQKDGWPVFGDPDTGTASWWNLRLELQGIRISAVHHGRFGSRPWTEGNVVLNLAAEILYRSAVQGEPHPQLAFRSHYHRFFDTFGAHPVRLIQTPAWQLHTAYTHKVVPEAIASIGGVIVVIQDGTFEIKPILFRPKLGAIWRE